jgi:hypothetical protein CLOSPO_02930
MELIKPIEQYSGRLTLEEISILDKIGTNFKNNRNYFYSRYNGINNLINSHKFFNTQKQIVSNKEIIKTFNLPARYWKIALMNCLSNIKTEWSNTKRRIRANIFKNENIDEEERNFMFSILKNNEALEKCLKYKKIDEYYYTKFKKLIPRFKTLLNKIRRYVRKCKGKTPHTDKIKLLYLDTGLYDYKENHINISTLEKRKRISIKVNDNRIFKTNLIIKWDENRLRIISTKKYNSISNDFIENEIGVDKGITNLISTSSGNIYGRNIFNKIFERLEKQFDKDKNRQRIFQYMKALENDKKIENIKNNNLTSAKRNKFIKKTKTFGKNLINREIKKMIRGEKPTLIVKELLNFKSTNNKFNKKIRNRLNKWYSGYINEKIELECNKQEIKFLNVNPAYTSQICNSCNKLGKRNGEVFVCENCGRKHADINAAINILRRKDIKKINLYTKKEKVKEIFEKGEVSIKY